MSEPSTTLTDALLAILAIALGLHLALTATGSGSLAAWLWSAAFLATALAAGLGSLSHGFGPRFSATRAARLWATTLVAALLANAGFLAALVCLVLDGWPQALALVAIAVGLLAWVRRIHADPRYRHVIKAGAITMVSAGLLTAWAWWQGPASWAPWVAAGLVFAALGAGIQSRGIGRLALLNHNDVYHVLQGMALVCWYWAAAASS